MCISTDRLINTEHEKIFGMHGLKLDQLLTFVEVVATGSFSAAAVRLELSQPAVSLQVRNLEKRLGVRLLERVGRRVRPTDAGAELLDHAARIDGTVGAAVDAMARHATGVLGRVRVGTGATACIFVLPPVLRDLRRRCPTLEITITTGNTGDVVKAVEENRVDVGLVTMPVSGRMLEVTPVLKDPCVLIAPPDWRLAARITPEVVAARPFLSFEPAGNTRVLVDKWFARGGVSPRPIMSLGSVEAIKELVSAGLGCAILPRTSIPAKAVKGRFIVRDLSPALRRTLALVIRRDKVVHRGLREVANALLTLEDGDVSSAAGTR